MCNNDKSIERRCVERVHVLDKRVSSLENNQKFFQDTVLAQIKNNSSEDKNIYSLLGALQKEVASLPEKFILSLSTCKEEVKIDIDNVYARRDNTVTVRGLITAISLFAVLMGSAIGITFSVMSMIDNASHMEKMG